MNPLHPFSTLEEARAVAEKEACTVFSDFRDDESIPILAERYLEAEYCWMFFRNEAMVIPPEYFFRDAAFAVSKRRSARMIVDFSDDRAKLQEYLLTMSNFFKDRGDREDQAKRNRLEHSES